MLLLCTLYLGLTHGEKVLKMPLSIKNLKQNVSHPGYSLNHNKVLFEVCMGTVRENKRKRERNIHYLK